MGDFIPPPDLLLMFRGRASDTYFLARLGYSQAADYFVQRRPLACNRRNVRTDLGSMISLMWAQGKQAGGLES